ncbi:DDE-type integrase/transposase/recombinase [Pseudocolwellia agarivorans]|uniref:DDE-type integrase/transposase/recombinase n=1 Tax=Pseudocolwellia agarivorans TaxID=1911682 RepID=UPI00098449F2|nr:DDE-type integrase/transposase/recombinase [Pseudocolwellia agarivorans]
MRATIANLSTHQRVNTPTMSGSIKYFDEKVVFLEFDNGKHHHLKTGEFISSLNSNKYTLVENAISLKYFPLDEEQQKVAEFRLAYCEALDKLPNPCVEIYANEVIDNVYEKINDKHPKKPAFKTCDKWRRQWISDGRDIAPQVYSHHGARDQRMSPEVQDFVYRLACRHYLLRSQPPVSEFIDIVGRKFKAKRNEFYPETCPTEGKIRRFLKRLPKHIVDEKRHGKAYAKLENRSVLSSIETTFVLERVECDGLSPNLGLLNDDGSYAGKVSLFFVIDCFTRCILGYTVQLDKGESSAAVVHSLSHSVRIQNKPSGQGIGGIGLTYVLDNGPGYRAEATKRFLSALGAEIKFCASRTPQEKPYVEAFNKKIRAELLTKIKGYVPKKRKEDITAENLKSMARTTVTEFLVRLEHYIYEVYHKKPLMALKRQTPLEVWNENIQFADHITLEDMDDRLLLRGREKRLTPSLKAGIQHRGQQFHSSKFKSFLGGYIDQMGKAKKITVLIDDFDASAVTAILPDGTMLELLNSKGSDKFKDVSFSTLKSQLKEETRPDTEDPLTAQKAHNIINRKRRNGEPVPQEYLTPEDFENEESSTNHSEDNSSTVPQSDENQSDFGEEKW